MLYWYGFTELSTTRPFAGAQIPWNHIVLYGRVNGAPDPELFLWVIRRIDNHVLQEAKHHG